MRRITIVISLFFCSLCLSNGYSSNVILKDMLGQNIPFNSLKGKWVLLNYWASWCQPCLDEIAELNRFYKHNRDKVAIFAVNYDVLSLPSQIALIRKYNITYPSLRYDPAQELQLGEIRGVPATFVFNPKGKLSDTLYGGQTIKSLSEAIM